MIYLVRHGQTLFNAQGRLQERLDSPLTDLGRRQAVAVGSCLRAMLASPADTRLESSPLGRARDTAEIIRATLAGGVVACDARLREISLGSWDGLTPAEIEVRWPGLWRSTVRESWAETCPDGEPYDAAVARLAAWLSSAIGGGPRIVVSHGGAISILRGLHLGLSRAETLSLAVPHGVIFALSPGAVTAIPCG